MKTRILSLFCASVLMTLSSAVWANESCSSAKKLVQGAKAFYGDKAELRDVIQPQFEVILQGINGHPDPSSLLYRWEGIEHRLLLVEGRVDGLESAVSWSEKGELCSIYTGGPLPETKDKTVSLSVFFQFPFHKKSGSFNITEINEGAKDGSKIMKSLAPTGLGFAAPSLKTFIVMPETADSEIPVLTFLRGEEKVTPKISKFNRVQYVRLKDLKSAKVDVVRIDTPYKAFAFFKIDPEEIAANEEKRLSRLEADQN